MAPLRGARPRFWVGDGTWTRTGCAMTWSCDGAHGAVIDKFRNLQALEDARGYCLDAPADIARGGIVCEQIGGEPVLFASERRAGR